MNDTFMKTKPVFPLLVSMALPNVISMLVNSLYNRSPSTSARATAKRQISQPRTAWRFRCCTVCSAP